MLDWKFIHNNWVDNNAVGWVRSYKFQFLFFTSQVSFQVCSFDSNSRNKPGAGFVFLTKNVVSGGPAAILLNSNLPFSSTLTTIEGDPKEESVGVTEGDNNRSSILIGWSMLPFWAYFVREVQTMERKFKKGKYKSKNYIAMQVSLCSEKGS